MRNTNKNQTRLKTWHIWRAFQHLCISVKIFFFSVFLFCHLSKLAFCLLYPMSATIILCYVIIISVSAVLLFHLPFPRCFPLLSRYPSLSALLALFKPQLVFSSVPDCNVCILFFPAVLLPDFPVLTCFLYPYRWFWILLSVLVRPVALDPALFFRLLILDFPFILFWLDWLLFSTSCLSHIIWITCIHSVFELPALHRSVPVRTVFAWPWLSKIKPNFIWLWCSHLVLGSDSWHISIYLLLMHGLDLGKIQTLGKDCVWGSIHVYRTAQSSG